MVFEGSSWSRKSFRELQRIQSVLLCSSVVVSLTSTTRALRKPVRSSQRSRVGQLGRNQTLRICFFFQAEDGIRDLYVTGVQTCALPISRSTQGEPRAAYGFCRREN